MQRIIKNGTIINRGVSFKGTLLIINEFIAEIYKGDAPQEVEQNCNEIIDATGKYIIPGVIDDQVHFREPGNTYKGDIESESKAAILGGVTSYMDMPNNNPPTTTNEGLANKFNIAKEKSYANYSFYLGATNDNIEDILHVDKSQVCGIKLFMGSSTGNMLVNNKEALKEIFKKSPILIALHSEDEEIIRENTKKYREKFNDEIPFSYHPKIRSRQGCIECTKRALTLAIENNAKLHLLHISTKEEIELIKEASKINPNITAEACVHYMWFNSADYKWYNSKIKCNPAIKDYEDMIAIREGVKRGYIKVVATDHAPHTAQEKENSYLKAPSGLPMVQHSLQLMLELCKKGIFTIEEVVKYMCHQPAELFNIDKRGFLDKGYYADIVIIDPSTPDSNSTNSPAYKCGWSPLKGLIFSNTIEQTFVNGECVVKNSKLTEKRAAMALKFNR